MDIDNLRVRSSGSLSNVQIIDERIDGNLLVVTIKAEVNYEDACPQSSGSHYTKSAAVTAFTLQQPLEANLGDLHNAPQVLSKQVANQLTDAGHLKAISASHLLIPGPGAATRDAAAGNITDQLMHFKDMDVQFIITGVIRDLQKFDPSRSSEGNILVNTYDKLDYRGRQHMRNFAMEVFVYDGYTGALIFREAYRDGGLWHLDDHTRTGFGTAAFLKTDYGQKVRSLVENVAKDLDEQLKCEPFRARILATDNNLITINAGAIAGIRPGDKLSVYRKSIFYDPLDRAHVRLENTRQTLVVNEVHPLFATGRIQGDTSQHNIQQDDVVLAW